MSERDTLLWERWQQGGSAEAFGDLAQRYAGMVFSACRRVLRDDFAAEDAARAAFLDLIHHRGPLTEPLSLWLYRAAVRHAESRRQEEVAIPLGGASDAVEAEQMRALHHIDTALLSLPDQLQEVVVYRFLADYSHEAAAAALNTTEAAVRQRISKAIERIRLRLQDFGVEIGTAALTGVLSSHLVEEAPGSLVDTVRRDAAAAAGARTASLPAAPLVPHDRKRRSGAAALLLAVIALLLLGGGAWHFLGSNLSPSDPADLRAEATPDPAGLPPPPETSAIVGAGTPLEEGEAEIIVTETPMTDDPRGNGTISGQVRDAASGAGLPDIGMGAFDRERGLYAGTRAVTDARGNFTIEELPAGNFLVLPTSPAGYRVQGDQDGRPVQLRDGQAATGIDFQLERLAPPPTQGAAIAGRVRDRAGAPVENAFISALGETTLSTYSLSDGTYRLPDVPEGTYDLSATHAGFRPSNLTGIRSGTTTADFTMEQTAALDATVISAGSGAPITVFEVDYVDAGAAGRKLWDAPERVSSASGAFVIDDLYAGELTLGVRAEGYQPVVREVRLSPGAVERLEIALRAEGRYEGRVLNSAGEPIEGAYIFQGAVPQGPDWKERAAARSDANGLYVLEAAPAAGSFITAFHPDYAAATANEATGERITLPDGGVVEGSVNAAGTPLAGAEVTVQPAGAPPDRAVRTVTAADGRFEFLGLTPGEATLSVRHATHGQQEHQVVVRARERARAEVDLGATNGTLRGRIDENGDPVAEARVLAEITPPQGQPRTLEARSGAGGEYTIPNVPPGRARLEVEHRGMLRGAEVDVAPGAEIVRDISFGSGGGTGITGRALGIDWNVYGASILALQGDVEVPQSTGPGFFPALQPHLVAQTEVQTDGNFTLSGLPPGPFTVVAVIVPRTGSGDRSQIRYTTSKITLREGETTNLNFDFN